MYLSPGETLTTPARTHIRAHTTMQHSASHTRSIGICYSAANLCTWSDFRCSSCLPLGLRRRTSLHSRPTAKLRLPRSHWRRVRFIRRIALLIPPPPLELQLPPKLPPLDTGRCSRRRRGRGLGSARCHHERPWPIGGQRSSRTLQH